MVDLNQVSREFLRALRGHRSQVAFSRRLGYSSNVSAEWESGRRTPYALTVLQACKRVGLDASEILSQFSPSSPELSRLTDSNLALWLASQRGQHSIVQLSAASGLSRYQVSRFFSGTTRPRLHEFFALVSACTGRLSDLVFALVREEDVPCLTEHHRLILQSRRLAFEQPWMGAIVAALECMPGVSVGQAPKRVAASLGLEQSMIERSIAQLLQVSVLREQDGGYHIGEPLVIDTRSNPTESRALRRHWAEVGAARVDQRGPDDLLAYNVFSVSRDDYAQIRQLQLEYYQRVRMIVSDSKAEVVALMNMQLVQWSERVDSKPHRDSS